jgi:hypothetical protein
LRSLLDLLLNLKEQASEIPKSIFEAFDRSFGVLCLSETPTETLMWSHYSDGGRGAVIQFKFDHPWFWIAKDEGDLINHLQKVHYSHLRAPAYLSDLDRPDYF